MGVLIFYFLFWKEKGTTLFEISFYLKKLENLGDTHFSLINFVSKNLMFLLSDYIVLEVWLDTYHFLEVCCENCCNQ